MEKRALIVDDHPIIRDSLVTSLVTLEVFDHVETCESLKETMDRLAVNADYQLLILDLSLTDVTGTYGMVQIREKYPDIPVVIFSGNDTTDTIAEAFEWGVHGFVSKNSPMPVVVNALQMVLAGSTYIPPNAIQLMGFEPAAERSAGSVAEPEPVHLTPRQMQVFDQLMLGVPNKVIADRLNMAEGTVKTHLHSIYRTLRVRNRAQAILRARQLQMVS